MKEHKVIDMPLAQSDIKAILDYLETYSLDIALRYASLNTEKPLNHALALSEVSVLLTTGGQ